MQRRHLLQALAAVLAAPSAFADTPPPNDTFTRFQAARAGQPWTLGFVGTDTDAEPLPLQMSGRIPAPLQGGAFWRNGPARHQLGGFRFDHWFDGDGLLQRYALGRQGIVHQARFVRTPRFQADSRAGRPVRLAFGTAVPGAQAPSGPDDMNAANTSVLWHGGQLMALWEGGSATVMDPDTLQTQGFKTWRADYTGVAFSAHPRVEPDGTLWNFGVTSSRGLLSVYRIARDGTLLQALTQAVPHIAMVHDFAVTERHLVFLLPPLVWDAGHPAGNFLDRHVWKPELGLRVLVLPKAALDQPLWFELPAGFVFHLGNACEDGGVIRLDCVQSPTAQAAQVQIRQLMQGRFDDRECTRPALLELDLATRRARQSLLDPVVEFPRVDPRVVGRRYRHVFMAHRSAPLPRPGFDAVLRLDVDSGASQRYVYGPEVMVEEHVFVPRDGGSQGEGWLLGTALDLARQEMLLSIFDAQHLADGPLAQGRLPRVMPLGLHGIFVGA